MPLLVTDTRTIFTANDNNGADAGEVDWSEATTSNYLSADFGGREGLAFVGYDVDIETLLNWNIGITIPLDMSGNHYGGWLRITNAGAVDTKANGGMQLCLRDNAGNESYHYVGGSDTYSGGWSYFVVDLDRIPEANNGANAVVTDALSLGVGFKMLAKSGDDNCQMDLMHYGVSGLVVTGTPDTATYGDDNAMQELYDIVNSSNYGLVDKQAGVFVGKGPVKYNDDTTGTCTFNDAGHSLVWADLPVSSSFYKWSLGSSTGITSVRFGTVVGVGDDRQGVNGGSIQTAGQSWSIDFKTNLNANASNDIKLYGISYSGAKSGLSFDDNTKTSIVSMATVNCGEIDPGSTNNGAEILGLAIIDPEDVGGVNNYGLLFPQIPSAGVLSHNIKKVSFITSGTPTNQWMLHFVHDSDYSVNVDAFKFFGNYASGTLWHGLNEGLNSDIIINLSNESNPVQTEFSSTNGGTVVVNAVNIKTITGLPVDCEARVVRGAYTLAYEDNILDGDFVFSYTPDNRKALMRFTLGGYTIENIEVTLDSTDQTLPATVKPDQSYIP